MALWISLGGMLLGRGWSIQEKFLMAKGQVAMPRKAKKPEWDGAVRGLDNKAVAVELM